VIVPVAVIPPAPADRVSPSQIATWTECQRKWAWRHIAKVVLPPHKSAALGTETHAQLEEYLKTGKTPDFTKVSGYLADSALHLLPPPMTQGLEIEKHFSFMSATGVTYHGYMDVSGPDSSVFPDMKPRTGSISAYLNQTWHIFDRNTGMFWDGDKWAVFSDYVEVSRTAIGDDRDMVEIRRTSGGCVPFVSDHKTTSDFKYAKTPDKLRTDPQGVIYAKAVLDHYKSDEADLIWTYILTKGARKAKRVHLHVLRQDVEQEFAKIELVAAEIVATRLAGTSPLDLPPAGLHTCEAYGGCPYWGTHCTDLSVLNLRGKKMPKETEDFLNEMTSLAGGTSATAGPGPSAGPSALPDWMNEAPSTVILPPAPATDQGDLFAGLVPKPAPTAPPSVAEQQALVAAKDASAAAARVAINPPGESEPASASLLPRPEPPAPKKTRAPRRTKEQMAADKAAGGDTYTEDAPTIPAPPSEKHLSVLYVDCFPVGAPWTPAEIFFGQAAQKLRTEGTDDYRLIDYKGGGIFRALVRDIIEERVNSSQVDVVLDSRTPEGSLCLADMSTQFDLVVRGMR
jgi:hypothetical protein